MRMNWYGYDLVTGVLSQHEGTELDTCARSGKKQRFHRITNARVDWINQATSWTRNLGQPACYDFATINGTRAAWRCF